MLEVCRYGNTDCFANCNDEVIEGEKYIPCENGYCTALANTRFKDKKCHFYKPKDKEERGKEDG